MIIKNLKMEKKKIILVFYPDPEFLIRQLLEKMKQDNWQFISFEDSKKIANKLKSSDMVFYFPATRSQSLSMITLRTKISAKEILFGAFDEKFELREKNVSISDILNLKCINHIDKLRLELAA